jgi:hypothetical protein
MKRYAYSRPSENIIGYELSPLAKSEHNDCVVLSISSAFEIPYDVAHEFVRVKFGRQNRRGTSRFLHTMDMMSSNGVELNNKKFTPIETVTIVSERKVIRPKYMTVNQFIMKYPKGTYILTVTGHAFTVKNGVVIGNPQDSTKIKRRVHRAYKVF